MTREQLTAILTATRDTEALHLDDGSYLDWSTRAGADLVLEAGDSGGQAIQLALSRADAEALVHRLAATLLAEAK